MFKRFVSGLVIAVAFMSPSFADEVDDLLAYYVKRFTPETAHITVSGKPDSTGAFSDVWLDLRGIVIDKLRMDSLKVRMKGVQFNKPSEWAKGKVECSDAISVQAVAEILEADINRAIENRTFGHGEDKWHDLSLAIRTSGLSGRGYYNAGASFLNLDILIEIVSGLKIVKGKELWLNNPKVKINKLDLPDYMTKQALSKIQPLVNLNKFPLPVTLHKVQLNKGSAVLSTRTLPKELSGGIRYTYTR